MIQKLPTVGFSILAKLIWVILLACANQGKGLAEDNIPREAFPRGELFEPLVADPKEPQFSTGFHHVDSSGQLGRFTAAVVSYGEHFGLLRWGLPKARQWQLSIVGALFAQFNMDGDSKDLINADYTVGLSGTYRYRSMSYRLRVFHQSSHLGDELLLGPAAPERINLSLEAMDFVAGYEKRGIRFYGGGIYLLSVEPSGIDRMGVQFGVDLINDRYPMLQGHLVGGLNYSALEGDDWNLDNTFKVGLEYGRSGSGNRRIRIMLERYDGNAPYGQFYDVNIESYGVSLYLLF